MQSAACSTVGTFSLVRPDARGLSESSGRMLTLQNGHVNWVGEGTGREVKGEDCQGEGAEWERER